MQLDPIKHRELIVSALRKLQRGDGSPNKLDAVYLRLFAISEIVQSNILPQWSTPSKDGSKLMISEPVWLAAAREGLVYENGSVSFSSTEFVNNLIHYTDIEGNC